MNIRGYPWIAMDIHGYPWIPMDTHGYPWISMDIHAYPWISMDVHGEKYIHGSEFHGSPVDIAIIIMIIITHNIIILAIMGIRLLMGSDGSEFLRHPWIYPWLYLWIKAYSWIWFQESMKYNTKGGNLKNIQETRSATRHGVKQKDIKRTETTKNAKCKAEGIKCVCAQERCHVCTGTVSCVHRSGRENFWGQDKPWRFKFVVTEL